MSLHLVEFGVSSDLVEMPNPSEVQGLAPQWVWEGRARASRMETAALRRIRGPDVGLLQASSSNCDEVANQSLMQGQTLAELLRPMLGHAPPLICLNKH